MAYDRANEHHDEDPVITSLRVVEMASAFRRKYNRGDITVRQRDDLLVAFFEEYRILPLESTVFEVALDLVLEDDLRILDALQLAAALHIVQVETELTFVAADRPLVTVANDRGLQTWDPTQDYVSSA